MADVDIADSSGAEEEDSGPGFLINNRYRILTGTRLPELDLCGAEAVAVRDEHYPNDQLFARVCPATTQPRLTMMAYLRHMADCNVMRPLDWGDVPWPGDPRNRLAVIFYRPDDETMMAPGAHRCTPIPSDELARQVIAPTVLTLGMLSQRNLTHRAIRPDNIYRSSAARGAALLGDCICHAPALTQPLIYEPIDSAMTPPIGRGEGMLVDDFYALGATLLVLATGQCALFGAKETEIIEAKLARGSFAALLGNARPPFGMRELLRGLVADDPTERWGFQQLEQWLGGGLRATVQDSRRSTIGRTFEFDGREYANTRALAHAFGQNTAAASRTVVDPEFSKWLQRNMDDTSIANRVDETMQHASGKTADARQLSRVCSILDRDGPIRFKSVTAMGSALGQVLADAILRQDNDRITNVGEAISSGIAVEWYMSQSVFRQVRFEHDVGELKIAQNLLRHTGIGYGVERCLYALNPAFPCISDVLGAHYVTSPRELLPALEDIVRTNGSLPRLVDRHLVAFIASRIKANIDRRLAMIEAAKGDGTAVKLGILGILAAMQSRHGPAQLPLLTEWLARELEPSIGRINGRSAREAVRKRLAAVAGGGSLVDLNACLNNDKLMRADQAGRRQAMREFMAASREIAQLDSKEFQDTTQQLSWKIAAGISATVAAATVCIVTLM